MKKHTLLASVFVGLSLGTVSMARADADAAKKDLSQAQTEFDNQNYDNANTDLQLAEADLDGMDDATKTKMTADIAALRKKIVDIQSAGKKDSMVKDIDSRMEQAKGDLSMDRFNDDDKDITSTLAQDDYKTTLGDEAIAKYLKTLSTYRKVAQANQLKAHLQSGKDLLDQAEKDWPDKQKAMENTAEPGDQQSATDDFGRDLDKIQQVMNALPGNNADAKALQSRYAKLQSAYNVEVFKGKAAETYSRLKDSWDSYKDEYDGWDKETDGPSFDDILHHQGDTWSALKAPKSVALIKRANYFLGEWLKDDAVNALQDNDPKLKGLFDQIRGDRKTALDKMAKFASAILDQAEKTTLTQESRDRLEQLASDDLRLALEGSEQEKPLADRAMKLVRDFDQKAGGDAAARDKLYADLVAQSGKVWPTMAAKVQTEEAFDAGAALKNVDNFKGKAYRFKAVRNRMGWDFSPGNGFEFAMSIDGTPVAAKYSQTVSQAIKEIEKKTLKDFSDEEYDVIATVEDVGPIIQIARAEGTIKTTDGETVGTIHAEHNESVLGVRMKIVAIHVGPVAAAEDQGEVDPTGNIVQPGAQ